MKMTLFITQTTVIKEWGRQKELGGTGKGHFSTFNLSLLQGSCRMSLLPRSETGWDDSETVSGVKSVSSFLYVVTQYFTAHFMRCTITSIAKRFFFQQLSAVFSTDWWLFLSQGSLCFTGILCFVYLPVFKVSCGVRMSQKWFPQAWKAVKELPVYWADDQILRILLYF